MRKLYAIVFIYLAFVGAVVLTDGVNNGTTVQGNRAKKARMVRKLKGDFKKLKKQEGALKLVDGNGDYEGTCAKGR